MPVVHAQVILPWLDGHDLAQTVQRVLVLLGVGELLQHVGQDVVQGPGKEIYIAKRVPIENSANSKQY